MPFAGITKQLDGNCNLCGKHPVHASWFGKCHTFHTTTYMQCVRTMAQGREYVVVLLLLYIIVGTRARRKNGIKKLLVVWTKLQWILTMKEGQFLAIVVVRCCEKNNQ